MLFSVQRALLTWEYMQYVTRIWKKPSSVMMPVPSVSAWAGMCNKQTTALGRVEDSEGPLRVPTETRPRQQDTVPELIHTRANDRHQCVGVRRAVIIDVVHKFVVVNLADSAASRRAIANNAPTTLHQVCHRDDTAEHVHAGNNAQ